MSFISLGLDSNLAQALTYLNYTQPTAIQAQAIPAILQGQDLLAAAQTGTGKTAAFVLPVLQQLGEGQKVRGRSVRALILVPTRELAQQVGQSIADYGRFRQMSYGVVYGGVDSESQKVQLAQGLDVLVATPGRLLDLAYQRAVFFDDLQFWVLDEADKMLAMGLGEDLDNIRQRLPLDRQTLLFSATLSKDVRYLVKRVYQDVSRDLLEIEVAPQQKAAATIEQWMVAVDKDKKSALLSHLIKTLDWQQAIIFVEKKHSAAKLVEQLAKRGIMADAIHGGRSQAAREQVFARFKAGELPFLVATDIAARGLDVAELARVINYDLPYPAEEYIHRIGRTGRAGKRGEAVSLVSKDDFKNLCQIESLLGYVLARREFEAFPVKKTVPISILNYRPQKKRLNHDSND